VRGRVAAVLLAVVGASASGADEAAEPSVAERGREAFEAGVALLVSSQNENGSWGHHAQKNPYRIYAPVPGAHRSFRVASTALSLMALRRAEGSDAVVAARRRGLAWLVENARVKRSHGAELYNSWAHAYALQCFARYLGGPVEGVGEEAIRKKAAEVVDSLVRFQHLDGGWGYLNFRTKTRRPSSSSTPFTTATVLLAVHEAKARGVRYPEPSLRRALRALRRGRTREGTYLYSLGHRWYPQAGINRPQGSLTRNPGCDLALIRFGDGGTPPTERDLERSVRNLLAKRKYARMALHRPIPHESWFAVSGYFYLYGYYHAAEACARLPEDFVDEVRDGLVEEVLATRHPDGSFWDFPLYGYHKPYGTGYALLALAALLPEAR